MSKTKAQREEEKHRAEMFPKQFDRHALIERMDMPVRIFEMGEPDPKDPKGGFRCCHRNFLAFFPGKIVIFGDTFLINIPFGRMTGALSANGYDLDWFAGKLGSDYLKEKFPGTDEIAISAVQKTFSRLYHAAKGTEPNY